MKKKLLACVILISEASLPINATNASVSCTIDADDVDFGNINTIDGLNKDIDSIVTVTCEKSMGGTTKVSYSLNFGCGLSKSCTSRKMYSGSKVINYNLYRNAVRTSILGNGSGGTKNYTRSYNLTNSTPIRSHDYNMYARIKNDPSIYVGKYVDEVQLTVVFSY